MSKSVTIALTGILSAVLAVLSSPASASGPPPSRPFLSQMVGGNTVGANIREARPRADGYRHLDTPATIARLKALHANHYTYGIWESPSDWDDLRREFAPAARRAGIDILVYLVPPSECADSADPLQDGRCAEPYRTDFVAWARAIGRLARQYPNVTGWAIDDFLASDQNRALFTRAYLERVKGVQAAIAPAVKFYSTLYFDQIAGADLDLVTGVLDGVIYPYLGNTNDTVDPTFLRPRLDAALERLQGRHLDLVLLVYTGRFLDSIMPPTESAVAATLRAARPYLRDGRLTGLIAYGAPMRLDLSQPVNEYHARTGPGELSLSTGNFTATGDGGWAQATQRIRVDPHARTQTLRFFHFDQYERANPGYHTKQVLIDGRVVWQRDAATDPGHTWVPATVDLTAALAGKRSATLAFRLLDVHGVGWAPIDVGIDDVRGHGLTVRNGGFDRPGDWTLSRSDPGLQPLLYTYRADRPVRIFNAIGAEYARLRGQRFRPVPAPHFPGLQLTPANQAMYGNGRFAVAVPDGTEVPAGACAAATQRVRVEPGQRRYVLDFWHLDDAQVANPGGVRKQVVIDGRTVWSEDTSDYWPWDYIEGAPLQGPLDVTDVVRGRRSVTLSLRVCTSTPASDYELSVGFDTVSGQGLAVRDGGFESRSGWRVTTDAPLTARIG